MYRVSGAAAAAAAATTANNMATRSTTAATRPALRALMMRLAAAPVRSLCCSRALAAVDSSATPAAPASGTGFGPKRVIASRVPVSKRAQRAAEAAAAAAATAKPTPAAAAAAAAAGAKSTADVDAAFLAFRPHNEVAAPAPPAGAPAVAHPAAAPAAASAAPAAVSKLSPTQLAANFPHSRNLSAHQPPSVANDNPYVHDRWFLSAEAAALPPQSGPAAAPLPECYITQASQLPELCKYLARTDVVALDTEFATQGRYRPKLELIQLATPELLAAVDVSLLRGDPLFKETMRQLFSKHWIVHSHRGDMEVMFELAVALGLESRTPAGLFDTQIAFAFLSTQPSIGYAALLSDVLGVRVDKSATLSDWSMRPLTTVQIEYAINDVKYLFQARDFLTRRLRLSTETHSALRLPEQSAIAAAAATTAGSGREAWFTEEMQLLVNPLLYEAQDPALAYTNLTFALKKLQSNPTGLAVFRALTAWREQRARVSDQPAQWILSTDQLQSMALSPPTSVEQLAKVTGIKKVVLMQHGAEIVKLVNSVLEAATAATEQKASAATAAAAAAVPATPTAVVAVAPDFTFPTLSIGHRDASRLKWDMFSLMSSVVESRSRAIQLSPFVMAPRRDLLDMASLSLPSIRTAATWRAEKVGVQGDAEQQESVSKDAAPTSFQSTLLPSVVNFRFAAISEDVTFDRLLASEDAEDAEEAQVEGSDAAVVAVAPPAAVAAEHVPGEAVMLSPTEELQLLSRSKLLRGWRRSLIGNDILRVTEGEPVGWRWNVADGRDGKGFAQLLSEARKNSTV